MQMATPNMTFSVDIGNGDFSAVVTIKDGNVTTIHVNGKLTNPDVLAADVMAHEARKKIREGRMAYALEHIRDTFRTNFDESSELPPGYWPSGDAGWYREKAKLLKVPVAVLHLRRLEYAKPRFDPQMVLKQQVRKGRAHGMCRVPGYRNR